MKWETGSKEILLLLLETIMLWIVIYLLICDALTDLHSCCLHSQGEQKGKRKAFTYCLNSTISQAQTMLQMILGNILVPENSVQKILQANQVINLNLILYFQHYLYSGNSFNSTSCSKKVASHGLWRIDSHLCMGKS